MWSYGCAGAALGFAVALAGMSSDFHGAGPATPGRVTADFYGVRLSERAFAYGEYEPIPGPAYAWTDRPGGAAAAVLLLGGALVGALTGATVGLVRRRRTTRCT